MFERVPLARSSHAGVQAHPATIVVGVLLVSQIAGVSQADAGPEVADVAPASAAATATEAPESAPREASCSPDIVARALRDLFPPASANVRLGALERAVTCKVPDVDGVLAGALALAQAESIAAGGQPAADVARALVDVLARSATPIAGAALQRVVGEQGHPETRAIAAGVLARRGALDRAELVLNNPREADEVRAAVLKGLHESHRAPREPYLRHLVAVGGPELRREAAQLLAEVQARPLSATGAALAERDGNTGPGGPSSVVPTPPRVAGGPVDGRPLAMTAAAVAGAALMVNLSSLGVQTPTTQLLLGSSGAVIGFGTAWGLSRFGLRPTLEQAAWFANATAWGTLAGYTIFSGSGIRNERLRYGSLVLGEAAGMAAGVWGARRWRWTTGQVVMSDALVLGAGLASFGVQRIFTPVVEVTPATAIGVLPVMVAAAIVGHRLAPTRNDLALMATTSLGGA